MRTTKLICLFFGIYLSFGVAATIPGESTYYVNGDCGNDKWTGTDQICAAPNGPKQTIQAAIDVTAYGDTVLVAPGHYTEAIDLSGHTITLQSQTGHEDTIIDASGLDHATVRIASVGPSLVLDGFTITGGTGESTGGPTEGGGIFSYGSSPTIKNCLIVLNNVDGAGGGARFTGGSPSVENCIFRNNTALIGGGLHKGSSSFATFTDCLFEGNSSELRGGGAYFSGDIQVTNCTFISNASELGGGCNIGLGGPTLTGCHFSNNVAYESGGGLAAFPGGDVHLNECEFTGNEALEGGGVYLEPGFPVYGIGSVTLLNCTISNNVASVGGGIAIREFDDVVVDSCQISENFALVRGGGMHIAECSPAINSCNISTNTVEPAFGEGGGIYSGDFSSPTLNGCIITMNIAGLGGGMFNFLFGQPVLNGCEFSQNTANYGGGLYNIVDANALINNCTFTANAAAEEGGGMFNRLCNIEIQASTIEQNTARFGAGIFNQQAHLNLNSVIFLANEAQQYGGGMYSLQNSTADLDSCTFMTNRAINQSGSGMYFTDCQNEEDPMRMVQCVFTDSIGYGPAFVFGSNCYVEMTGCEISENHNGSGYGAVHGGQVLFEDCTIFSNNGAGTMAAHGSNHILRNCLVNFDDIRCQNDGNVLIENTYFQNSQIVAKGDGIAKVKHCTLNQSKAISSYGNLQVFDCTISYSAQGAYIHNGSAVFANCLFWSNGIGIDADDGNDPLLVVNCLFKFNNVAIENDSLLYMKIANCTFWQNEVSISDDHSNSVSQVYNSILGDPIEFDEDNLMISYSNVLGGWKGPGIANINEDPLFVDPATLDFRLMPGSPCIDAALNNAVPFDWIDLDDDNDTFEFTPLDGNFSPRFVDDPDMPDVGCGLNAVIDMGAFEFQVGSAQQPTVGDIDGDLVVGMPDLLILLALWGSCDGCCLADLNVDNYVSVEDLLLLFSYWD